MWEELYSAYRSMGIEGCIGVDCFVWVGLYSAYPSEGIGGSLRVESMLEGCMLRD